MSNYTFLTAQGRSGLEYRVVVLNISFMNDTVTSTVNVLQ